MAKSFRKIVVLSDIAVDREQAPGRNFPPHDAGALAAMLLQVARTVSPVVEAACRVEAERRWPERFAAFGRAFQDIVLEAVGERRASV